MSEPSTSSSLSEAFTIRACTPADAETVAAHRRAMFFDIGHRDEQWLNDRLPRLLCARAGWIDCSRRRNVLNVYTRPSYRSRGLARRLQAGLPGRIACPTKSCRGLVGRGFQPAAAFQAASARLVLDHRATASCSELQDVSSMVPIRAQSSSVTRPASCR